MTKNRSDRLHLLQSKLDELGVDAMLVSDEINVRYLCGFTGDSSSLLVEPNTTTVLSDGRYETQLDDECPSLSTVIRPPDKMLGELTAEVLNDKRLRRVGIEANELTVSAFRKLTSACETVQWVETTGIVESQRMVKDADEIATTRQAVRIAEAAFESVSPNLTSEITERDVAFAIEATMRSLGAEGCSFSPIVAAGSSGALPHYRPSDRPLGGASTLLIDWGAKYHGYASDLTRTLHRPSASDAFRRAYEAVLEAQLAAIDAIGPGVATADVDAVARAVLARHGMAEAFKHGLGHGTGLQIHESPRMSASSQEVLSAGMIVTVEPGVYFAGKFGIRIEDDVLVTPNGREVLSGLPKGLDQSRWLL